MERSCQSCGGTYETKRSNARFCSARCNKRAQRGQVVSPPAVLVPAPGAGSVLVAAVTRELEAAGRLDTALGQTVLVLAGRVESGSHTGSAVASLVRELRVSLAEAVQGASRPADPLAVMRDELARRRS